MRLDEAGIGPSDALEIVLALIQAVSAMKLRLVIAGSACARDRCDLIVRRSLQRWWQVRARPTRSSALPCRSASDLDPRCSPDQRKGSFLFERLRPSPRPANPCRAALRVFGRGSEGGPSRLSPPPEQYACWRSFGRRLLARLRTSSWCGVAVPEPQFLSDVCTVLGIYRIHALHAEPKLARNSDGESDLGRTRRCQERLSHRHR